MAANSRGSNGAANSGNSLRTAMSARRTTLCGSAWTVVTLGGGSSYLPTVLLYLPTMVMSAEADAAPSSDMIGMAATARPATNLAFIIECPSLMRMGEEQPPPTRPSGPWRGLITYLRVSDPTFCVMKCAPNQAQQHEYRTTS